MKTSSLFLLLIILVAVAIASCVKNDIPTALEKLPVTVGFHDDTASIPLFGSVSDIDSNVYSTMLFGSRVWMTDNLKTTRYNDGSPIEYVGPGGFTYWFSFDKDLYCWYDNDPVVNKELGAIYNWHAVTTGKLCPTGWHVPAYEEWTALINSMGGAVYSFNNVSDNAQVLLGDLDDNIYATNFNRGPGGCLCGWGFLDRDCIDCRYWWTSTPMVTPKKGYAYIASFHLMSDEPQSYGFNVRCVKD